MPTSVVLNVKAAAILGGSRIKKPNSRTPFDIYMTVSSNAAVTFHANVDTADKTVSFSSFAPFFANV